MSHPPDADLFPTASGTAKQIVDAHQTEQPLKLYSGWFCPFVQRAWSVLEEKKIPYQYIEVNPYKKPESLVKLNPRALVPTLQYDNKPLFESTVICEFLEEAYPNHGTSLLPANPYERARMRIWIDFCTSRIIPAYHRFLQFQPMSDTQGLEAARHEFLTSLKEFTKELDTRGPFFAGPEPTLIDFIVAPWAVRLWVLEHYKGKCLPQEGDGSTDELLWKRFRVWQHAVSERPSIRDITSDRKHYMPVYQRYHEDKAQSQLAQAVRKGRGVP